MNKNAIIDPSIIKNDISNFSTTSTKYIKNKLTSISAASGKKFLIILFCTIIFICVAIYVYKTHIQPKLNPSYVPNKEFIEQDIKSNEPADLYFFYTSWCPHCKTAMPIWNKFKENTNTVKGTNINFYEIDCDKDSATAEKYNVEGYPTIKLVHNDKVITYDAKPDIDTLKQFLKTSI
tara:strand:- start:2684 stop:3217 length:534 start_codon:yes stop_codon:yes gene_type:complete